MTHAPNQLPIAIVGAGPVGLAAAAHLALRGMDFVLFEAGSGPGAAIENWRHVTFFSPWRYDVDAAAQTLLEATGWRSPDPDRDPKGGELIDLYLAPLAAHPKIAPHLRYGNHVLSIARQNMDRVPSVGRDERPFEIVIQEASGKQRRHYARAVIDASGTWERPNPAGASGVAAIGEAAAQPRIRYGIPDVFGRERARYAGRKVMVIGAGHSAMDSILGLARLKAEAPATEIVWAMRSAVTDKTFGGLTDDQLSSRGALGARAKATVESGAVRIVAPFRVAAFELRGSQIAVSGETAAGERQLLVDEVIVATGFRPDFSALSELRLDLHPWLECPRALGPLIDPNEHSCGTVPPHGFAELSHPEKDFYIVGMKSYGRAPTFLAMTGYEQVRSIVAALAGDLAAAREVKLALPETGVCEGLGQEAPTSSCCKPACCGGESNDVDDGKARPRERQPATVL